MRTAHKLPMFIALTMRFDVPQRKSAHAVENSISNYFSSLNFTSAHCNQTERMKKKRIWLRTKPPEWVWCHWTCYISAISSSQTITLLLDVLCVRLGAQQTPPHRHESMRTEWFSLCGSDARVYGWPRLRTKNAMERISRATIPSSARKVKEQL